MPEVQKTVQTGEMTQRFIEFVMMHAQNAARFSVKFQIQRPAKPKSIWISRRMFIDQLEMVQEKTRGNLTNEEMTVLRNALSNLQMAFVEVSGPTHRKAPRSPNRHQPALLTTSGTTDLKRCPNNLHRSRLDTGRNKIAKEIHQKLRAVAGFSFANYSGGASFAVRRSASMMELGPKFRITLVRQTMDIT